MLNGTSGDAAARRRGSRRQRAAAVLVACRRLIAWRRRCGGRGCGSLPSVAISRKQQELNEFEAAAKRGGAAVDLVTLFSFPLRKFYPWRTFTRKPRRGAVSFVPPSAAASARVVGLHPLSKASSGLPSGSAASASVDLASLPASRVQLRRALAASSRRKLQGVLRVKPAPAPASAGDDTAAAARVAALVAADESGRA